MNVCAGFDIALWSPRIPQNVGAIGRLCASIRAPLHVIRPIPFQLDDASLKRSAMDYWDLLELKVHNGWEEFRSFAESRRIFLVTRHASQSYTDVAYQTGDILLFGNESHGAPQAIREELGEPRWITLPMLEPRARSLNLSMAAAVASYEAIRQIHGSIVVPKAAD